MKNKKNYHIVALLIFLLIFLAFSLFIAPRDYSLFKQRGEFAAESNKIEPWMNLKTISSKFNITKETIIGKLNISEGNINSEASLARLCIQYKRNCTQIIEELNKIK